MARVLYISYDGLLEPLGQSQVFQYLRKLSAEHNITLLTYEKADDLGRLEYFNIIKKEVLATGINWKILHYHKMPSSLATAYDIIVGILYSMYLVVRYKIRIVHARSYVPSIPAIVCKWLLKTKFVFDMRGFWADERIDGQIWSSGSKIYRIAKWFERRFLLRADVVVSLTKSGVEAIREFPYFKNVKGRFEVISTCTNLDMFSPLPKPFHDQSSEKKPFVLGYVGSAGTWYMFHKVARFFDILLKIHHDAHLYVVNKSEHEYIKSVLSEFSIPLDKVTIEAREHSQIPAAMNTMDAGIFFIKPKFSKKASAPTKMGEFLAYGIPCVANAGVGDVESILNQDVGVVLSDFSEVTIKAAVERIMKLVELPLTKKKCVTVAETHFSLDKAVSKYNRIYHSLQENCKQI
jgi:glycosyltransferase involved in cell wall biosynthesis